MSVFRSFLLICLISFSAAFGLLFLGSLMGYEEFRGGYAVVSADAALEDKFVLSLLDKGSHFFGGTPVSESSQWVLLDEFDSIKKIPLDQYYDRVFHFDPRNDGYADKLKEIFIKDDKRFFYIPLQAGSWNVSLINEQFDNIFGDIPYSVNYFGVGRPLYLFFAAYGAASLLFFIICLIKRKNTNGTGSIIALIPVFSSLAFFGAHGIACAAVFSAFFILLKDLCYELKIQLSGGVSRANRNFSLKRFFKNYIFQYRFCWLFFLLFPAVFACIVYFSQVKILFICAVFASSLAVFILSQKIISVTRKKHKRFNPVLIIKQSDPKFAFPVYILPFAAAAVFVLIAAPYMTSSYDSEGKFDVTVGENDYHDHLNFQVFFSVRKIGSTSAFFPEFFYDADGLPSITVSKTQSLNLNDFPPFPLKPLLDFFEDVNSGQRMSPSGGTGRISDKLLLLVLLPFLLPGLFARKKSSHSSEIKLKILNKTQGESSGKYRFKGINWNKKKMYNNSNYMSIQKDA